MKRLTQDPDTGRYFYVDDDMGSGYTNAIGAGLLTGDASGRSRTERTARPGSTVSLSDIASLKDIAQSYKSSEGGMSLDIPSMLGFGGDGGSSSGLTQIGTNMDGSAIMGPASSTASTGGWGFLGGGGGMGPYALGAAGAYGMYDLFGKNAERGGTGKGMLQGAASGAAIGTAFAPGIGTAIGAGLGGLAGAFSTKSRTRGEQHQRDKLIEMGINVPINEAAPDGKEWELNEKFRRSRNEADLTGKDIMNASDFYLMNGYDKLDAAKKEAIANKALELKLVREKLGKININTNNADYRKFVEEQLGTGQQSGGISRQEAKKQRARAVLGAINPAELTSGPRYDLAAIGQIKNQYL